MIYQNYLVLFHIAQYTYEAKRISLVITQRTLKIQLSIYFLRYTYGGYRSGN
jgi:hypothetical protein